MRPAREATVVYEMHIGSFAVASGKTVGTFADALGGLPDVADLGATTVEVMPIQHFGSGPGGWGYDPDPTLHPSRRTAPPMSFAPSWTAHTARAWACCWTRRSTRRRLAGRAAHLLRRRLQCRFVRHLLLRPGRVRGDAVGAAAKLRVSAGRRDGPVLGLVVVARGEPRRRAALGLGLQHPRPRWQGHGSRRPGLARCGKPGHTRKRRPQHRRGPQGPGDHHRRGLRWRLRLRCPVGWLRVYGHRRAHQAERRRPQPQRHRGHSRAPTTATRLLGSSLPKTTTPWATAARGCRRPSTRPTR